MNRQGRRFLTPLVLGAIVWAATLLTGGAATAVEPNVADFGEVPIHTSSTIPVSLTNNESGPMVVFLKIEGESGTFGIDTELLVLAPGQTISVPVTFSPTEAREFSSVLNIQYGQGQTDAVQLKGVGVSVEEKKGVQGLLDFFDEAVGDGTLKGYGPGKSAEGRLNALRNMLVEAAEMENAGDIEGARGQLLAVIKKLQEKEKGKSMPFAEGDAVPELISMIQEAVENLGQGG